MEILHQSFQQKHQISLILLKSFYFYNLCNNFSSWMFKNEVFDKYMYCIMKKFKINAQVSICSLADLNIDHYVELTFLEGKLIGFLVIRV